MNTLLHPTRRGLLHGAAIGTLGAMLPFGAQAAELDAQLDAYIKPYVDARDYSGAILITRKGKVLAKRTYGFTTANGSDPIQINSRFAIQSISKLITQGTIYKLEDAGVLHTSDSIARWMPDFPRAKDITIDMLIAHTAGVSRDLENAAAGLSQRHTLAELVKLIAAKGLIAEPGKAPNYSNNGYRMLGYIIEQAGNAPYHATAKRLVTDPLGMHDTGAMFEPAPIPNLAIGSTVGDDPKSLRPPVAVDFYTEQGAASFYSTVEDLARLVSHYPFRPEKPEGTGRVKYGHDGFGNGYMSNARRFPETETIVTMLGNIESGFLIALQNDLEAMPFGDPLHPPPLPTEIPIALSDVTPFEGNYSIGPGRTMKVAIHNGRLSVNAGDDYTALWAIGGGKFFSRERYATMEFVQENGKVVRIDWSEAGQTFPCPRVG